MALAMAMSAKCPPVFYAADLIGLCERASQFFPGAVEMRNCSKFVLAPSFWVRLTGRAQSGAALPHISFNREARISAVAEQTGPFGALDQ